MAYRHQTPVCLCGRVTIEHTKQSICGSNSPTRQPKWPCPNFLLVQACVFWEVILHGNILWCKGSSTTWPHASFGITTDMKLLWTQGMGFTHRTQNAMPTPSTLLHAGEFLFYWHSTSVIVNLVKHLFDHIFSFLYRCGSLIGGILAHVVTCHFGGTQRTGRPRIAMGVNLKLRIISKGQCRMVPLPCPNVSKIHRQTPEIKPSSHFIATEASKHLPSHSFQYINSWR